MDVAYEGFRITRRKPLAVLTWAGVIAILYGLFQWAAGPWMLIMFEQAQALEGVTQPTPEQVAPAAQAWGVIMLYSLPLMIIGAAVLSPAVVRAVLTPEDSRMAYIRFGKDEGRVLGVKIMMAVTLSLVSMISFTLVGLLLGFAAAFPPLILLAFVAMVGAMVLMVWLALRFSLAVPATLAEGRIALDSSMRLTKGHSLRLVGVVAMAVLFSLLVSLLLSMTLAPLNLLMPIAETSDPVERVRALLAQGALGVGIAAIINGLVMTAQFSLIYAPFAAVYQRLKAV